MVSEPARLEEEREFARKNRDKFKGFSNNDSVPTHGGGSYSGFGSKDLEKMGGADAYRPGGSYDPYKKDSIFGEKKVETKTGDKGEKKKKKKKKKKSSSSSESSDEESDSEEEEEKPKKFKKTKGGLGKPPKKGERKDFNAAAP